MSQITITPIQEKVFGAVITNVRLPALIDAEFTDIHAAFLHDGFLVFPCQFLSDAENIAFGKRFGELEFGALPIANQEKQGDGSYGGIYELESQRMRTNIGNEAWHTDSTYWPVSSKCFASSASESQVFFVAKSAIRGTGHSLSSNAASESPARAASPRPSHPSALAASPTRSRPVAQPSACMRQRARRP